MFFRHNPFEAVRDRSDLTGLEKLRLAVRLNQSDSERTAINIQSIPIFQDPQLLTRMLESNRRVLTPYFLELIEEGNRDGSIHTEYPKELAELLPLLTSLWLLPSVFPATTQELKHKFRFLGEMFARMGLPLMDEQILALADAFFDQW